MLKLYTAHPISGLTGEQVVSYIDGIVRMLGADFEILHPMTGKGYLRTETEFKAHGYGNPVSTNHAIVERDAWMVGLADVVLVDLREAKGVSIGCMMELAWAHMLRKHTIVVMENPSVHWHAFVLEAADIVFPTLAEAMDYLHKLAGSEW